MTPHHARLALIAARLELELKRIGRWTHAALDPARLVDMGAFGMKTLAAEEWLQFILLERMRTLVSDSGSFPNGSATSIWASRQFSGDPDAGDLLPMLRELDALCEPGADPLAHDEWGVPPLFQAAAGGQHALRDLLGAGFEIELPPLAIEGPTLEPFTQIADALLDAGANPNQVLGEARLSPLMVARCFGQRGVAERLLERGANPALRDAFGRTAEGFTVFVVAARLTELLSRIPAVAAAYLVQVHAPLSHQFTTPLVGLELCGPLPHDAFSSWPSDEPLSVMNLDDDGVSRLIRLAQPLYRRKD